MTKEHRFPQLELTNAKGLILSWFKAVPRFGKGLLEFQQAQQNITISQVVPVFLRFLELTVLTDLNMRTFW